MGATLPDAGATVITFRAAAPVPGFTSRDLMELAGWHTEGRRLVVEDAQDTVPGFALIYAGAEPWASWGVSRQGAEVLVWNCITLADLGRFPTMRAALAAVPDDDAPDLGSPRLPPLLRPSADIIVFRRGSL